MLPWGKFWRLLQQFEGSGESYYARAREADEELAGILAEELVDDEAPWKPPAADWTLLHEMMAQQRDRLGEIAALLADLPVGVKQRHTPPPMFARPDTALSKAMARIKREREEEYDAKLDAFVSDAKARWRRNKEREEQEAANAVDD